MTKKPYPGFSPNFLKVGEIGGLKRTCFVLEALSTEVLGTTQIAMIEEQISATADRLVNSMPNVEKAEFVTPDRFDRVLANGLRLPTDK
jgi:hypothetical protein